ncbi:MAG: hypothetical protein ACOY4T_06735 [Pseudomonadota bacterium]
MSALKSATIAALVALPVPAFSEPPLSAIDWLSRSVAEPASPVALSVPGRSGGPAGGPINVSPLGGPTLDGIGLLPSSKTGLPFDLWGSTPSGEAARLLRAERIDTLPSIQSLLYMLLLAETAPPRDADADSALFLARVDKLLDLGALDPALALLELPPSLGPEAFRRRFDAALLLGQEDRACAAMRENAQIAPSFPARIFCLARGGDWDAAALSLRTGEALGFIAPGEAPLLERFLDPGLAEGEADLPVPDRPSPLVFRMMEAIGQPLPTTTLPLAFAQSDLRSNSGLKTRIEAAERLARTGAIEANLLLGLYTEQAAPASGGVWDRVRAVRDLDDAVARNDTNAIAIALPLAWNRMAAVELEVPLAEIYGERLAALGLGGDAGGIAFRLGLLSSAYQKVASARVAADGDEAFLIGLALGDAGKTQPPDQLGAAVRLAFVPQPPTAAAAVTGPDGGADLDALLAQGRRGEAILRAIDHVTEGARGDLRDVTAGLRLLRSAGLEGVARRAALELILLDRRG